MRGPEARMRLITALLIAALLPVLGQLLRLQVLDRDNYVTQVEELVRQPYALPVPPRGIITDRNGDLLVGNAPIYNVGAEINLITDTTAAADELVPLLGVPRDKLLTILIMTEEEKKEAEEGPVWRPLVNGIGGDAADRLVELRDTQWMWLTLEPTWRRFYAEGVLAAHTIGFVNAKGDGYGIEALQQRFLRPQPAENVGEVDILAEPLAGELAKGEIRAYPGTNLKLTIDRTIQAFVEGELDRALVEFMADGGTILVLNPQTGEILASASRPTYDPGHFADYPASANDIFVDPVVSTQYEPGSVFKVLTAAAALDSGKIGPDWSYYDNGQIEYGGVVIQNWDRQPHGQQNLQGILDNSLNVGVATFTTQYVGADTFYRYVRAFGFGQTTGIGLANEAAGQIHLPSDYDWTDSFLAVNTFGQGIAVTPLQIATAISALANHGTMMTPYVIAERAYADGRIVTTEPRPYGYPVSAGTADLVAEMMANIVDGRYKAAQIPGYRIAGKSGTAQIPMPGGYDPSNVITSFIGFGPLPDPQLLVLVKLDRPQIEPYLRWGTQTAAPVFQRVMSRLLVLQGIPPSEAVPSPQLQAGSP